MKCRFDALPLSDEFVDLGFCPPSNAYLKKNQLNLSEVYYPLKLYISDRSFLVQVDEVKAADEIFSEEYAYFSSYSKSWLKHAENYVTMMVDRFGIDPDWQVVELASNDGYLLQYFKQRGVPVLGVDPSLSVATAAEAKGIDTRVAFFGRRSLRGKSGLSAYLVKVSHVAVSNGIAAVGMLGSFEGDKRLK